MEKKSFKNLAPQELHLLKQHLALGEDHLKKWLTEEEISQILNLAPLDKKTAKKMQSDNAEIANSVLLAVNTVVSSIFGTWLGMNSFIEYNLLIPSWFIALSFVCLIVGGLVGLLNYKMTHKKHRKLLIQRKCSAVEMAILDYLHQHTEKEVKEERKKIVHILEELGLENKELLELSLPHLNEYEICLNWLHQAACYTSKEPSIKKMEAIKKELSSKLMEEENKLKSPLYLIVHKLPQHPASISSSTSWIKRNMQSIFVSAIPIIFSSFASLIVYLTGAPTISKELHKDNFYQLINAPHLKIFQLGALIVLAAFLIYIFLRTNYRAFKRDEEMLRLQAERLQKEAEIHLLDIKYLKFKKMREIVQNIQPLV